GGDESIPTPGNRLDELRLLGRVVECRPQLPDRGVQAVVEVDELVGPELLPDFVARNDVAGAPNEQQKQLKGLILKPDPLAVPAQLAQARVELKSFELSDLRRSY